MARAIAGLKDGKAQGGDGIPAEVYGSTEVTIFIADKSFQNQQSPLISNIKIIRSG